MKVLHINSNYLYTTLHEQLIKKLNRVGIENTIFMPNYIGAKYVIEPEEYVVHPTCFNRIDRYLFYYKQKKIYVALYKHLNISSYGLIHAHTLFTDGNVAYNINKQYGIPYIVTIRSTDVNVFLKKRIVLRKKGIKILRNAKNVTFISCTYRDEIINKYVPKKFRNNIMSKSIIIPNGIDDFWLNNRYKKNKKLEFKKVKIIFAGRIDANKNIGTTIKVCKALQKEGIKANLTVVGKVEDIKEYEKIIKHSFVKYIPMQTKEELIKIYRENDILLMPSFNETFGLVYAEAISQGLPVIYTKGQGFDGQFENGVVGYAVKNNSPNDILKNIWKIVCNYEEISKRCVNLVDKFDWNKIVKVYLKIYGDILN